MPKFIPKSEKEQPEKKPEKQVEAEKKDAQASPEELEKLKELEQKFGKMSSGEPRKEADKKPGAGPSSVWEKMDRGTKDEAKPQANMVEQEVIRRTKPPEGSISKDHPDYISQETLEKRRRELSMTEAKLRTLEREEQDINKRLEYLRREHSAMEMAIKEKTHLEREIAELREDRDRIKLKLDELKSMEGQLEQKTWDELKRSPATGAKISALERRIHELEGQILEINEERLRSGETPADSQKTQPVSHREPPRVERKAEEIKPQPKVEEKPAQTQAREQPKQEEKKQVQPVEKKKSKLAF
ncbi:hypothetical protein GX441_00485 [bacterium]|nr:hypothetical protein [bacterium]